MNTLKKIGLNFCIGLLVFTISGGNAYGQIKKAEEIQAIKTVKIGNQEWMFSNLNVAKFRNGDVIFQANTPQEWEQAGKAKKPAWCYYENKPENGKKYGKLYNWYAVNDPRGIAPEGWHVPTNANWSALVKYLGRMDIAGRRLKDTIDWKPKGRSDNSSGFSGLPGGICTPDGKFENIGNLGQWWSTSGEIGGLQVYSFKLIGSSVEARFIKLEKGNGLSIRCIKD